jgi:hypothetical protein
MAAKQFDAVLFWKFIWLMDSLNDNERQRATEQAVRLCRAAGLRFGDAMEQTYEEKSKRRVVELEAEIEDARRCGDRLAQALEKYRARERWCRSCEIMRRVVAVVIGGAILTGWYFRFELRQWRQPQQSYGALFALAPFVFLVCRWAVMQFKRRNHWYSFRDNDVFRAVANAWNRFLERFEIEV